MRLNINVPITKEVYSRKWWNKSGIEVLAGEEYKFECTGVWKDLLTYYKADGYVLNYLKPFEKFRRSKMENWFALIGSIDKMNDFLIGDQGQLIMEITGQLYFYANDVFGMYWNNSGHISVTITRVK